MNILLGESAPMRKLRESIEKLAQSSVAVHITGESGTGKELAARMIHERSARHDKPFVAVNCGAIPADLMESEFFGYKKGAFTGSIADRDGYFQAANGGTLFLDEVADLPLMMQVKLLRVLQDKAVRRLGENQEKKIDVRIISASNKNLFKCVKMVNFREDLYYRLCVINLITPSLREMRGDISIIAKDVIKRLCKANGRAACDFINEALDILSRYDYPGNVRELENILERAIFLCDAETIEEKHIQFF